jgi:hypothetical protein
MSKCRVQWGVGENGEDYWICHKFMMGFSVKRHASAETCYLYGCPGRRDKPVARPLVEITTPVVEEIRICAERNCDKPVAPNKHNHCSEECRKRANRYAYKQRQKEKNTETSLR